MSDEVTLCFGCKKPIDFDTEDWRVMEMYPFGSMREVYFHSDLEDEQDEPVNRIKKGCFREFADSIEVYESE